jgi:hypothetical protein
MPTRRKVTSLKKSKSPDEEFETLLRRMARSQRPKPRKLGKKESAA